MPQAELMINKVGLNRNSVAIVTIKITRAQDKIKKGQWILLKN